MAVGRGGCIRNQDAARPRRINNQPVATGKRSEVGPTPPTSPRVLWTVEACGVDGGREAEYRSRVRVRE